MVIEKLSLNEENYLIELLNNFRKTNEPYVEINYSENVFSIYVVAKDWAGIMDAVLGIFHDEGYNIHFAYAVATENDEAIIVLKIKNLKESDIIRLIENKNKLLSLLKTAIKGGFSLTRLLNIGTKKIKIYNEVMDKLKEMCSAEEYKEIVSDNGELMKFILSRSEQYLSERKPEDLAYIVYKSYKLQKEFLKTGKVQVDVKNYITTREKLTGITLLGYHENVTLDDLLDALKEVIGNYQRKFDKEFITDEGVAVIRLEITDEKGDFIEEEKHALIVNYLKEEFSKPREKRSKFFKIRAGMELYGRILIPYLISEVERTTIPQMLILPEDIETDRIDLRVFIIFPHSLSCSENILAEIIKSKGFLILSMESKIRSEIRVIHMKLSAQLINFENEMDVYNSLKSAIIKIIPNVRDFDEGMRNLNVQKLNEITQIVGNKVSEKVVKRLFYQYDDVLRLNLSANEIAEEIKLIYNILTRFLSLERNVYDFLITERFNVLSIASKREEVDAEKLISLFDGKLYSFSIFEIYNVGIVVLRFQKNVDFSEVVDLVEEKILK